VWVLPDARKRTDFGTLEEFLAKYPNGRYDDPVDATVYAVELAARATSRTATSRGPITGG
jgi:hypothetical protein